MIAPAPQATLARDLAGQGLRLSGACAPGVGDDLGAEVRSILLVSPDEPAFWPIFTDSAECADGAPSPLDRWSERVLTALAARHGAQAVFPFGGPPWHPFLRWATASGRSFASPVGMLVEVEAGLFHSLRGALLVPWEADLPPRPRPCDTCAGQPCRSACPVGALTPAGYDTATCHAYLDTDAGRGCMDAGCAVRRACPVGATRRDPAQSAFHMRAFHR